MLAINAPKKKMIQKIILEVLFCCGSAFGTSFTNVLKIFCDKINLENGISIIMATIIVINVINSFHCQI